MTDQIEAASRLANLIAELPGKECWAVAAGAGTGSVVDLHFGRKLRRGRPLSNPHVSSLLRECVGEMGLLIECAWRLDQRDQIICGSGDSNRVEGRMLTGLDRLSFKMVDAIELGRPGLDLCIHFGQNLHLRIFCDHTDPDGDADNYSLFAGNETYVVGPGSAIAVERGRQAT